MMVGNHGVIFLGRSYLKKYPRDGSATSELQITFQLLDFQISGKLQCTQKLLGRDSEGGTVSTPLTSVMCSKNFCPLIY